MIRTASHPHRRVFYPSSVAFAIGIGCCWVATSSVYAQDEEAFSPPEEVFQAAIVYPQEQGEVQVTLLPSMGNFAGRTTGQLPVSIEYGLTDAWQMEVEWGGYTYGADAEDEQLGIGTQHSFLGLRDGRTHAALGLEVAIPIGEQADEAFEIEPFVTLAQDLDRVPMQLFAQVTLEQELEEGATLGEAWRVNTGAFYALPSVVLTAEMHWELDGKNNHVYVTPGVVKALPGEWSIGLGAAIGVTQAADAFQLVGFLSYEFGFDEDD